MSTDDETPRDDPESTEILSTRDADQGAAPARQIGPYRLLQKIGEGGMGEVWLAEQDKPIRRRVALKLIKLGMDTKQVVARFEAERQALALMNHPNVAKVFDAGADDRGRPFFVMEHVKGVPITEYCDRQRLTTNERLDLFVLVCGGIQHAHQNAIIHRDIKPSNVLVTTQDGRPTPKIIDFGVAKATSQRLTERTVFTELGQLIGTPEYMSPEQAEMTVEDVDTRTDVYSLGVLLYELLVGVLPFETKELRAAGFDEIRRNIREVDPPKPSTKFTSLGVGATEVARRRDTDARSLSRQLSGDLDWIAMRTLEKRRERRYQSSAEVAADITRYLRNEPVLACPPTAAYRLQKFASRHRAGVAAVILSAVALLGTLAVITGMYFRAEKARLEAREHAYAAAVAAAQLNVDFGDTTSARAQLELAPRELRGWEWNYVWNRLDRSMLVFEDSEVTNSMADPLASVFLDRNRVRTLLHDGQFVETDSRDGQRLREGSVFTHEDSEVRVRKAAFSADGGRVAMGMWDGSVRLFDIATGEEVLRKNVSPIFEPEVGMILLHAVTVALSDDGNLAFLAGLEEDFLWDWTRREAIELNIRGDYFAESAVAIAAGGERVAISVDGGIETVRLPSNESEYRFITPSPISALAFAPTGGLLAAGDEAGEIRLWDLSRGSLEWQVSAHSDRVASLAWSADGATLYSGGWDSILRAWTGKHGRRTGQFLGHKSQVRSIDLTDDGERIVTVSWGHPSADARIWNAQGMSTRAWELNSLEDIQWLGDELIQSVNYRPTDHRLIHRTVALAKASTVDRELDDDVRQVFLGPRPEITLTLLERPGNTEIILSTERKEHRLTEIFAGADCDILGAVLGKRYALLLRDPRNEPEGCPPVIFDYVEERTLHVPSDSGWCGAIDPSESVAAIKESDGRVLVLDLRTAEILQRVDSERAVYDLAFSTDGRFLAVGGRGLRVWEWRTGALRFEDLSEDVSALDFSSDGERLATGSDSSVKIREARTGQAMLSFAAPHPGTFWLSFSPDGSRLAGASASGHLTVWDSRPISDRR